MLRLHIVGGFLGSGKTTAIVGAAKHLMAQGKRVGVVTNDQGKYLVDTAFFHSAAVPAVEVTGGCFCCNYEDLDAQLAQLREMAAPDVIFAESVGSCADIVATVVKPLLELKIAGEGIPTSFTVFADARLLRRRLLGLPMPFSDDVVYLFDKQIEEAGMLVINKRDLLSQDEAEETQALAEAHFPGKTLRLQNSLDAEEVKAWVAALESGAAMPPTTSLEIDYDRYGAGEARLAWLDAMLTFEVGEGTARAVTVSFITDLVTRLRENEVGVGHLKFMVEDTETSVKVSFPTLGSVDWEREIPAMSGTEVRILVNARAEMEAARLHTMVEATAATTAKAMQVTYALSDVASFHPGFPNPTHRIG